MATKTDKPTPPAIMSRIGRLDTVGDAKHLMGRIIRASLAGKFDEAKARGFVWMLKEFANVARDHDLEQRLRALEELTPGVKRT